ncbi:MAG: PQQ-binding-like beta-propeller repeat protein [Planctomycetaceae bacterium]
MRRQRLSINILGLCAALAGFIISADAQAQSLLTVKRLPSERSLNRIGLTRMWSGQATINASRDKVRHLTADEEMVFVQSTAGVMSAFESETGRKLWAIQLGRSDNISYPAVTNSHIVLFAVGMKLFALERRSGDVLWELDLNRHPSTSPAMDEDRLYIGCIDGSVYAYNLLKIQELYNNNLLPQWSNVTQAWRFKSSKAIVSPPISNGRVISFASEDRSLYCATCDRRELVFQIETDRPVSTPLAQKGDSIFFGSADLNFYNVNMNNGRMRWKFVPGTPVKQAPQVIGDSVYITTEHEGMFCVSEAAGALRWTNPQVTAFVGASDERLYTSDRHGNLLVLAKSDGVAIEELPLNHFTIRYPNSRTDRMFMCTSSGLVIALREIQNDFPVYHQFPDNRPILPEFTPEGEAENPEAGAEGEMPTDESMPAEETSDPAAESTEPEPEPEPDSTPESETEPEPKSESEPETETK